MSLSLDDLKNKKKSKAPRKKSIAHHRTEVVVAAPRRAPSHRSSGTAKRSRPWTSEGVTRGRKQRKRLDLDDVVVNDEWSDAYSQVQSDVDLHQESSVLIFQEKLLKLEKKARSAVVNPLRNLCSFLIN